MKNLIITVFILIFSSNIFATGKGKENDEIPKNPALARIDLASIKGKDYFSLSLKHYPEWHTYWINPGDAGLAATYELKVNGKKIELKEQEWPVPETYVAAGDVLSYGYHQDYSLFAEIPGGIASLEGKEFEAKATWLVCRHICLPGERSWKGKISNGEFQTEQDIDIAKAQLSNRFDALPETTDLPKGTKYQLIRGSSDSEVFLTFQIPAPAGFQLPKKTDPLTPYPSYQDLMAFKRQKYKIENGMLKGIFSISWDGEFSDPEVPLPKDGKFKFSPEVNFGVKALLYHPEKKKSVVVNFPLSQVETWDDKHIALYMDKGAEVEKKKTLTPSSTTESSPAETGLLLTLIFAFLGGLILNIMPCVLPVISLKLFGLIAHSDQKKSKILKHNLFYSLGVISTLWLLAGIIVLLKGAGESVGWGFQLQSPAFVATMVIVIFLMTLNLFGLFEFTTPGGKTLGGVHLKDNFVGDFLGGVFATILSTPCSAPFLGGALTYAFSSPTSIIFLIFTFVGLGLASPFILTAIFPSAVKIFPKPGKWMENVKKILGLGLVLTVIWLMDVFASLVTPLTGPVLELQVAMALLFFAIYTRAKMTKNIFVFCLILAASTSLFFKGATPKLVAEESKKFSGMTQKKRIKGLPWEDWSREKMTEYKNKGQYVFMDFTAEWCLTCKANDKLVIDTDDFTNLVKENNVALLLGDWTKRNKNITDFLQENNLVGVPAYFLIKPDGTMINFGETISISKLEQHL